MYDTLVYTADLSFALSASEKIYAAANLDADGFIHLNALDYFSH